MLHKPVVDISISRAVVVHYFCKIMLDVLWTYYAGILDASLMLNETNVCAMIGWAGFQFGKELQPVYTRLLDRTRLNRFDPVCSVNATRIDPD